MTSPRKRAFINILFALLFVLPLSAQQPAVSPTPDDAIKVTTEEVHLNVYVEGAFKEVAPTLRIEDVVVLEDGSPQTLTSMRRPPASVLVLLDTGSELNFVKTLAFTRLAAKVLIHYLPPDAAAAVVQYHDRIEGVTDWTTNRDLIDSDLDEKLRSGKRSRLTEALLYASKAFESRRPENRHLVIISDGLESVADAAEQSEAMQKILAANVSIHVISYTQLEDEAARKAGKVFKMGDGKTKPRVPEYMWEDILRGLPVKQKHREFLKSMNSAQRIVILDMDKERRKKLLEKREAWKAGEEKLQSLAEDSGGVFSAPSETEGMIISAFDVAKTIGSQYVITFSPARSFADEAEGDVRRIDVRPRNDGIRVRARKKFVVGKSVKSGP
jgi:VWFA-related protein